MARVVLLSSSAIERDVLADVVDADDDLRVVIPAVEQSRLQWLANDDDEARSTAERVAQSVTARAPADASTVDVSPDTPGQALRDAIAEHRPDRIVVALREGGEDASWLEADGVGALPSEIDGVPVVRITL